MELFNKMHVNDKAKTLVIELDIPTAKELTHTLVGASSMLESRFEEKAATLTALRAEPHPEWTGKPDCPSRAHNNKLALAKNSAIGTAAIAHDVDYAAQLLWSALEGHWEDWEC